MTNLDYAEEKRAGVTRTVAFFDTMDYPPTMAEAEAWREGSAMSSTMIESGEGRLALPGRLTSLLALVRERTVLFPRKIRAARKVAQWLARNPNVRFVALANLSLIHI